MAVAANAPGRCDLVMYQGDDHRVHVTLRNAQTGAVLSPRGAVWKAQIRRADADGAVTVEAEWAVSFAGDVIVLSLPASISSTLAYGPYMWDLQGTTPEGGARTFLRGSLMLPRQMTLAA